MTLYLLSDTFIVAKKFKKKQGNHTHTLVFHAKLENLQVTISNIGCTLQKILIIGLKDECLIENISNNHDSKNSFNGNDNGNDALTSTLYSSFPNFSSQQSVFCFSFKRLSKLEIFFNMLQQSINMFILQSK